MVYSVLAAFHASSQSSTPCFATYLLTGEVPYTSKRTIETGNEMEVDDETATDVGDDDEADEDVSLTKVVLVPEAELDRMCSFRLSSTTTDHYPRCRNAVCAHFFKTCIQLV